MTVGMLELYFEAEVLNNRSSIPRGLQYMLQGIYIFTLKMNHGFHQLFWKLAFYFDSNSHKSTDET